MPELYSMKNKDRKIIIMYHFDEKNGIPYANNFYQKGYDNVYFLSGGIEEFEKYHPDYLDGPEKEKYVKFAGEIDVPLNPNTRMIAAGNTDGSGSDEQFNERIRIVNNF